MAIARNRRLAAGQAPSPWQPEGGPLASGALDHRWEPLAAG
jgi:hypothetical protein